MAVEIRSLLLSGSGDLASSCSATSAASDSVITRYVSKLRHGAMEHKITGNEGVGGSGRKDSVCPSCGGRDNVKRKSRMGG